MNLTIKEMLINDKTMWNKVERYIKNTTKNSRKILSNLSKYINSKQRYRKLISITAIKVPTIETFFCDSPTYEYCVAGLDSDNNVYDISGLSMSMLVNIPVEIGDNPEEEVIAEILINCSCKNDGINKITDETFYKNLDTVYSSLIKDNDDRTMLEKFNDNLLMIMYADNIIASVS